MHSLVLAALALGATRAMPATLVVRAPREAAIIVNGVRMRRSGTREVYQTAPLPGGRAYPYEVTVVLDSTGLPTRESRRVNLVPGRKAELDLFHLQTHSPLPANLYHAHVRLSVPAHASVRVNGQPLVIGASRTFQTPALRPGEKYCYVMEADVVRDGKPVTDRRTVVVEAGRVVEVDFRRR